MTAAALIALLVPTTAALGAAFSISLPIVASGFSQPVQVTNAGDGTDRLSWSSGAARSGSSRAVSSSPGSSWTSARRSPTAVGAGLLGLAFHPDFETNHRLFAYYTRNGGDIVLARYTAKATNDPRRRAPARTSW